MAVLLIIHKSRILRNEKLCLHVMLNTTENVFTFVVILIKIKVRNLGDSEMDLEL